MAYVIISYQPTGYDLARRNPSYAKVKQYGVVRDMKYTDGTVRRHTAWTLRPDDATRYDTLEAAHSDIIATVNTYGIQAMYWGMMAVDEEAGN